MNHKSNVIAAIVGLTMTSFLATVSRAATYDFETLILGSITNQDNWKIVTRDPHITTPAGTSNTSTKVFVGSGSGGVEDIATRINNANFSFAPFAGTERDAILQLDLRLGPDSIVQSTTAFGHDNDANGTIAVSEISRQFGGVYSPGIGITVPSFIIYRPSGFVLGAYPTGMIATDWVRAKLVMDLTANGGDGSGSVFALDLTRGDTIFTPVSGLQNINLQLTTGPAPTTWDGLFAETVGGTTGGQLDNITALIPEPATIALLELGAMLLFLRRRRG